MPAELRRRPAGGRLNDLASYPLTTQDVYEALDAAEEPILNALTAAETMTGRAGHVAYALPLDKLQEVMARYGRAG